MDTPASKFHNCTSSTIQKREDAPPASKPVALGTSISADLEALKNDVDQAKELACEYQRQLAGKSNDFAILRSLFDKTSADLIHLHKGISQLREERHQLANDAMRATALEMKLERAIGERDCLQHEVNALRRRRAGEGNELVEQLTREVERLEREVAGSGSTGKRPHAGSDARRDADYISIPFSAPNLDHGVSVVPTEAILVSAAMKLRRR